MSYVWLAYEHFDTRSKCIYKVWHACAYMSRYIMSVFTMRNVGLAAVTPVSRSDCSNCPAVSRFVLPSTAGFVYKLALRRTNVASDGN